MARARPGLAKAVTEIMERHGTAGKRLSFRQAERLTGLAPATVSELAKGNARTPETVRRFAVGFGEEVTRLLLLAGFVPEDDVEVEAALHSAPPVSYQAGAVEAVEIEAEEAVWLGRLGKALAQLPPCRERDLWKEKLRHDTELIESFLERISAEPADNG